MPTPPFFLPFYQTTEREKISATQDCRGFPCLSFVHPEKKIQPLCYKIKVPRVTDKTAGCRPFFSSHTLVSTSLSVDFWRGDLNERKYALMSSVDELCRTTNRLTQVITSKRLC